MNSQEQFDYVDLSQNRTLIKVNGDDSERFLQGLLSNDVKKASAENAVFNFLLTAQGKYIFDLILFKKEEDFYIDAEANRADELVKKLSLYKLRSKVNITKLEDFKILQIFAELKDIKNDNIFADPRNTGLGLRAYINESNYNNFIEINKLCKVSEDVYTAKRIELLVTEGGNEFEIEGDFPLNFKMIENNGVDFKKGCYVGQEVTARSHHRGSLKKDLFKFQSNAEFLVKKDELTIDNKKAGEVIIFLNGKGLAKLDIEAVTNSTKNRTPLKTLNGCNVEVL